MAFVAAVKASFMFSDSPLEECRGLESFNRTEWGALPLSERPCEASLFNGFNVKYLFLHHTVSPESCYDDCIAEMQSMQKFHTQDRGWCDIGYSWVLGSDMRFYEGRGWNKVGAHTPGFNDWAYALSIIGDYTHRLPTKSTIDMIDLFVKCSISIGRLRDSLEIRGHRQAKETECPGEQFYHYMFQMSKFGLGPGQFFEHS